MRVVCFRSGWLGECLLNRASPGGVAGSMSQKVSLSRLSAEASLLQPSRGSECQAHLLHLLLIRSIWHARRLLVGIHLAYSHNRTGSNKRVVDGVAVV